MDGTRTRLFGWWVARAFTLMVFPSTGIRLTVGPFLEPGAADLGLGSMVLSLTIRDPARPAARLRPAAGGR